jgi:cell wall-associated NlpC family hydrolase
MCDRVKKIGEQGDWYKVELPDGRAGYLPRRAAEDYAAWKQSRRPTAENIERTARKFLGRPYLWGGNSTKGFDCSGFVQQVFFLNGIDLPHNAGSQSRLGAAVPLDADLSQLKKGDLLFFGRHARGDRPERVTHIGIYLGDKQFIQSAQMVRISSLDPQSPIREEYRIRSLLGARRVLAP